MSYRSVPEILNSVYEPESGSLTSYHDDAEVLNAVHDAAGNRLRVRVTNLAETLISDTTTSTSACWSSSKTAAEQALVRTDLSACSAPSFSALAARRRNTFTGSGFSSWGAAALTNYTVINTGGLFARTTANAADANSVRLAGDIKTNVNGYALALLKGASATKTVPLPAAPSTSAIPVREDLLFLEVWHEKISDKDFWFPNGDVQFAAGTVTLPDGVAVSVANATGADFTGHDTYSLFGNWQVAGATVGAGKKWSTLTAAQQKSIAADPEQNIYLAPDGAFVQVRFRIRVVQGAGASWANVSDTKSQLYYSYASDADNKYVKPKGKLVSIANDLDRYNVSTNLPSGTQEYFIRHSWSADAQIGCFLAVGSSGTLSLRTEFAFGGLCYALPLALVSRRNSGAFHPVHNPNGSGKLNDGKFWYDTALAVTSTADCFTYAAGGAVSSGSSGRPDGAYHDAVYHYDLIDLRMSAKRMTDTPDSLLQKYIANGVRGAGAGLLLKQITLSGSGTGYFTAHGFASGFECALANRFYVYNVTKGSIQRLVPYASALDVTGSSGGDVIIVATLPASKARSAGEMPHCDSVGSPANYPAGWAASGIFGTPLIADETGGNLLPNGISTAWKLSRKVKSFLKAYKLTSGTWTDDTANWTLNSTTNSLTRSTAPGVADVILLYYTAYPAAVSLSAKRGVFSATLGTVTAMDSAAHNFGAVLASSLTGKVPVSGSDPILLKGYTLSGFSLNSADDTLTASPLYAPAHGAVTALASGSPAAKLFCHLTVINGVTYPVFLFKEMRHNGTSWGDNSKFEIADNLSTTTDNNGQTVAYGCALGQPAGFAEVM